MHHYWGSCHAVCGLDPQEREIGPCARARVDQFDTEAYPAVADAALPVAAVGATVHVYRSDSVSSGLPVAIEIPPVSGEFRDFRTVVATPVDDA
jgi:hypothetical protein